MGLSLPVNLLLESLRQRQWPEAAAAPGTDDRMSPEHSWWDSAQRLSAPFVHPLTAGLIVSCLSLSLSHLFVQMLKNADADDDAPS